MHSRPVKGLMSCQRPVCKDSVQIKRWAGTRPGWAVTSLFMTASKFDSAPTGSSQITRFLRPKGSPAHADSASASTAHTPAASAAPAPEHWLQSSAAGSAHAASEGAQHAAASDVPAAAAPAASDDAQAGSAASRLAEPTALSNCPVDAQAGSSGTDEHAPGPTTMAQGLAMSMRGQLSPGSTAAGALPASAAPNESLHDGSTERNPGALSLADLRSLQSCLPPQCAEGTDQQEWSKGRQQSLISNVPWSGSTCAPAQTGNMAEAPELHGVPVQQQPQSQGLETEQRHLRHDDQEMLSHGEVGILPEQASSALAPERVDSGVMHLGRKGLHEIAVIDASSAQPAQQAAPQPDEECRGIQEGEPSRYSHLSQEVGTFPKQHTPVKSCILRSCPAPQMKLSYSCIPQSFDVTS